MHVRCEANPCLPVDPRRLDPGPRVDSPRDMRIRCGRRWWHDRGPVNPKQRHDWKERAERRGLLRRSDASCTTYRRRGRRPKHQLEPTGRCEAGLRRAGSRRVGRRTPLDDERGRLGRGLRSLRGGRGRRSRWSRRRLDDRRRGLDDRRRRRRDGRRPLDGRRRRRGDRLGSGCGRLGGRSRSRRLDRRRRGRGRGRGRGHGRGYGQERERVEIPLRVPGVADAEVHVGHLELRRTARADGADHRALGDGVVTFHRDGAKMRQAHGQPRWRLDRDRRSVRRNGPGEADDAAGRREHRRALIGADRDPAALSRRVRVSLVERERLEERAADGPRPRARGGHKEHEQEQKRNRSEPSHATPPPCCQSCKRRRHGSSGVGCCQC